MRELSIEAIAVGHGDHTDGGDGAILDALAALGSPARHQPLFLVRSGVPHAQLAQQTGWVGDDLVIHRLDELGGMANLDLLFWAVPEDTGATVLIWDEPPPGAVRGGAAVGLRVCRGSGPLQVVDCDDACTRPVPRVSSLRYSGARPGEVWLAMFAALTAGRVANGDRILLHVEDGDRESWSVLAATDLAGLRLAVARQSLVPQ